MATRATIKEMQKDVDEKDKTKKEIEAQIENLKKNNETQTPAVIRANNALIQNFTILLFELTRERKTIKELIDISKGVVESSKEVIDIYITLKDAKLSIMDVFSKRLLIKNQKKFIKKYTTYDNRNGTNCVEKIKNFLEIYDKGKVPENSDFPDESVSVSEGSEEPQCAFLLFLFRLCPGLRGGKSRRKYKSKKRRTRRNR